MSKSKPADIGEEIPVVTEEDTQDLRGVALAHWLGMRAADAGNILPVPAAWTGALLRVVGFLVTIFCETCHPSSLTGCFSSPTITNRRT